MLPMQNIKLAVDAVVFGYKEKMLHILLIKQKFGEQKGKWALPGGFVKDEESLPSAVVRELQEETGVSISFLEQLYTFGSIDRDPRGRVVSVAHLGLINPSNFVIKADTDASDACWFTLDDIPNLAFDHKDIIQVGLERLRSKIRYQPIGFELLDREFPFSDLEQLYHVILGEDIDRRNFRKKLLSYDFIKDTNKKNVNKPGRPAKIYCFDKEVYERLERSGFYLEIKFV
ncbi:MAG: NUDIX hydrolase [Flavobacteriales bacterium]|jgi:8-oxo-dGTP diphosphatase|nr:NUDIX hydrolase [Flavobacteriales bacterium]